MKLDEFEIRSAFSARDWPAAVDALARYFAAPHIKSLSMTVRIIPDFGPEEVEVFTNRYTFGWESGRGFYKMRKDYLQPIDEEARIWITEP